MRAPSVAMARGELSMDLGQIRSALEALVSGARRGVGDALFDVGEAGRLVEATEAELGERF